MINATQAKKLTDENSKLPELELLKVIEERIIKQSTLGINQCYLINHKLNKELEEKDYDSVILQKLTTLGYKFRIEFEGFIKVGLHIYW